MDGCGLFGRPTRSRSWPPLESVSDFALFQVLRGSWNAPSSPLLLASFPLPPSIPRAGICHDFENAPRIAKLLYYESSRLPAGESTSFDEYISRCDPEQVGRERRRDGRKGGYRGE